MSEKFRGGSLVQKASDLAGHISSKSLEVCPWSWVCAVALCMTPVLLFPSVVFGRQVWTVGDLGSYNFPIHVAVLRQWRSGVVPLWNPYMTGGTPLAASMQGGVFYPPNWLLLFLPDDIGFTLSILAHIALTGVFTFAYLRSVRLSRWASLTGAVIFQLSGFVMSHLGHVALLRAIPWLPLILLGLQKWRDSRDWRWVCAGALGMGCSFLAGYPQITAYSVITALAYLLFLFVETDQRRWRFLGGGIALFVLGAGVASVQIALTAAAWNEYMRVLGASFEYFALYSFHPSYLIKLIAPQPASEMAAYVGVPTLLLIVFNLLVRHPKRRGKLLGFFAALAIFSLLLAFGGYTPLARWTYRIPIYGSFSVISRHLMEFDFSLAVLAAFGLDLLRNFVSGKRLEWVSWKQGAMLGMVGVVLLGGWVAIWASSGSGNPAHRSLALVWDERVAQGLLRAVVLSLITLGGVWLSKRAKWPRMAVVTLLLLLVVDLGRTNGRIYAAHLHSFDQMTVPLSLNSFLKQDREPHRVMSFVPHGNDPFFQEPRRSKWLLPNFNVLASIESATGYDAVFLAQLDEITNRSLPTNGLVEIQALDNPSFVRYLDLIGAKYLIAPLELTIPDHLTQRFATVFENGWVRVLLNTAAFPRIFYVPEFEMATASQVVEAMQEGEWKGLPFDPRSLALVERRGDEQPEFDATAQMFGSSLFLLNYALVPSAPRGKGVDGDWRLVTWWSCQTPVADDYTLYVHVLDENGQVVAQADHLLGNQTVAGFHPTAAWSCPAVVQDIVSVPLQVLTDPEALRFAVGVWRPETTERLSPSPGALEIDAFGRVVLGRASDMVSTSPPIGSVYNLKIGVNSASADLNLSQAGVVVHSSNYSSGWSARLDGQSVPLFRVDGFLQGVYVPAGSHHLEFVYRPTAFYVGAGISVLAMGLMVVVMWAPQRKMVPKERLG